MEPMEIPMMQDQEKTPADHIADGVRCLENVAHPKGSDRFSAGLLYQTALIGMESLIHGRLMEFGMEPESHSAHGLARESKRLPGVDAEFAQEMATFASHLNLCGDRPFRTGDFPLSAEEVRAAVLRILERLG